MRKRTMVAAAFAALTLLVSGCAPTTRTATHRLPTADASGDTAAPKPPKHSDGPDGSDGADVSPPSGATPTKPPGTPPKKPPASGGGGMSGPLGTQRTTGVRAVALTFDDGPHPVWTPKVLDDLKAAGVKATFCLIGQQIKAHADLVARMVREGHQLCNHSWKHDLKLGKKSEAEIRADLVRTNQAIEKAVPGVKIPYFRAPGGNWTSAMIKVVTELGMTPLHWDVDPQDWAKPGATKITNRVEGSARAGSIVLMHDGGGDRSGTATACPQVIAWLKKKYGIVRLA
ncbi:polysaccharide deacetylase family protein [Micromonospora zhanjiangensis]|uniref:Polysaccharide deacetylase family protein n=1 Tax=Micromonospora zhanjiangensis TaxID=1522057 RepID=A0ABV8KUJ0_9ACTN